MEKQQAGKSDLGEEISTLTPSPEMLELLVCPLTHTFLDYDAQKNELVSKAAGLAYPVRNGIPVMLPSEARKLEEK